MGVAMKTVQIFETAEEVVKAFSNRPRSSNDEFPHLPSTVSLVFSTGCAPYFDGDGSDRYGISELVTIDSIIKYCLDRENVRLSGDFIHG